MEKMDKIRAIASEALYYKEHCIGRKFSECPFNEFGEIRADDDGATTDLHFCYIGIGDLSLARYNVLTNPYTNEVVSIDLADVDFLINGILYDAVSIEDSEKFSSFLERIN